MIVWRNGAWLEADDAHWAVADRGALLGDGVFETLRVRSGALEHAARHEQRLDRSCAALGLPKPHFELAEIAADLAARNALKDAALRLTVSAGTGPRGLNRPDPVDCQLLMSCAPLVPPPDMLSLAISPAQRSPTSPSSQHKTLSYADNVHARGMARLAGADMALLCDTNGFVSCTDCANIFWVIEDQVFTPALECAVLPGTRRAALLEALDVREIRASPQALFEADLVFVTNALMGAVPVRVINGETVGDGRGVPEAVTGVLG